MSLPHILLGLLSEPASGYELKKIFDLSLRQFWSADLSQIYPALQRLEAEGLLSSTSVAPSKGPARRLYRRTASGTRELQQWLEHPPDMPSPRLGFLAQLFMMDELGDLQRSIDFVDQLREQFRQTVENLTRMRTLYFPRPAELPDDEFHRYLTFSFGMLRMEAALAWSEEASRALRRRASKKRRNEKTR